MLGLKILIHSFQMINSNWKAAIQISFPVLAFLIVFSAFWGVGTAALETIFLRPNGIAIYYASLLVEMALIVWAAVNWHRFILLQEEPTTFLPTIHIKPMGAYVFQSVLLVIVAGVFFAAASFGFSALLNFPWGFNAYFIGTSLVGIVVFWVFYRLSPVLPAAALERSLTIGGAWRATKPFSWAIFLLALTFMFLNYLLTQMIELSAGIKFVSFFLFIAQGWLSALISISVLTTIYGVAVENRDL